MHRFAALGGADALRLQALLAAAVAEWKAAGLRVAEVITEAHNLADRVGDHRFRHDPPLRRGRHAPH